MQLPSPRVRAVLLAAVALLATGLLLVASSAATPAAQRFGRLPEEYLRRQLLAGVLGGAALLAALGTGRRGLRGLALPLGLGMLLLSALTLLPQVGLLLGGARRTLELGSLRLQPTILLAATLPLALATSLGAGPRGIRRSWPVWLFLALGGGVCVGQPNFAHLATLLAAALGTLWGLGRPARPVLWKVLGASLCSGPLACCFPYVRWRLRSFLDAGLTRDTTALQEILQRADWLGPGLQRGHEKALLSAAPSDYTFAVALEELGWLGALGLLTLLLSLALALWRAGSERGSDPFARAVAGGCAAFVAFPALLHIAVCLRLVPVSGIHLPLVSASGSANLALLGAIGVALACRRQP